MEQKKPSVTRLLDILNKPALISWANKQGLNGIEIKAYMKMARDDGSDLHRKIELACKGEDTFDDPQISESFNNFMQDKKIISIEQDIETEWFVGRFDISFCDNNGEIFVADFKRGFKGKVYLENKLQLIAYTMAFPGSMAIVKVPEFYFAKIDIEDRRPYEELIIHLSKIYHLMKEIG
jgi:hypothetical protein